MPLHELTRRVRSSACGELDTDRYRLTWRLIGVHVTVVACLAHSSARRASVIVRSQRTGMVGALLVGTPWQGRQRDRAALPEVAKGVQWHPLSQHPAVLGRLSDGWHSPSRRRLRAA